MSGSVKCGPGVVHVRSPHPRRHARAVDADVVVAVRCGCHLARREVGLAGAIGERASLRLGGCIRLSLGGNIRPRVRLAVGRNIRPRVRLAVGRIILRACVPVGASLRRGGRIGVAPGIGVALGIGSGLSSRLGRCFACRLHDDVVAGMAVGARIGACLAGRSLVGVIRRAAPHREHGKRNQDRSKASHRSLIKLEGSFGSSYTTSPEGPQTGKPVGASERSNAGPHRAGFSIVASFPSPPALQRLAERGASGSNGTASTSSASSGSNCRAATRGRDLRVRCRKCQRQFFVALSCGARTPTCSAPWSESLCAWCQNRLASYHEEA